MKVTAEELAKNQREISVSDFFAKNRHLLGFDNPTKAVLTTVKEAVDNSLDACEEAGILPDIRVEIKQVTEERYIIIVEDNGPGIVKEQIANIVVGMATDGKIKQCDVCKFIYSAKLSFCSNCGGELSAEK